MNKCKLYIIFISLLIVNTIFAQPPDTLWTKIFGSSMDDEGYGICIASDGGYVMTGRYGLEAFLLKTDSSGIQQWIKYFVDDWCGHSVQRTADGGYILTGDDMWLIKTDSIGDSLWTKWYGFNRLSYETQETTDGGYVLVGGINIGGYYNGYILKTNANGDTIWSKRFNPGAFDEARILSVQQAHDGGFITTGYCNTALRTAMFVAKLDSIGDSVWAKIQDTVLYPYSIGTSIKLCSDSGYVIAGNCQDSSAVTFYCIMKTETNGITTWFKTYGPYGSGVWCESHSIIQTLDGKYILTGQTDFNGTLSLIKVNADGDTMWVRHYGDPYPASGNCIRQTNDNGYIVVGATGLPGNGDSNIWLLKIATDTFGIIEQKTMCVGDHFLRATIINGPLQLPAGKTCKVFDITGRVVMPDQMKPGIYFIEIDGVITQKVVKVR